MKLTDKQLEAQEFARKAHEGQVRKFNKEPYFNHVQRVADNTLEWSLSEEDAHDLYIAALLHDTIEDTEATKQEIASRFGDKVADVVDLVTKKEGDGYFDFIGRITDWADYEQPVHPKSIRYLAVLLKLSDLQDNMSDLKPGSLLDKYQFAEQYLSDRLPQ